MTDDPPIITGSREQLFHLLAEAAEIEHTLMCSYLYAVFSLKRNLPGVAGEMVARWRDAILSVAIEEMAHLVNVANLSIAVGGEPHFGRPNFPIDPGHFPSGVVVRLTPVSRETLEHFVHLERPQGVEGEDAASFDKPDYDREEAYHGVMPSVQDYGSVGRLYEAIEVNLRMLSERVGDDALFIGPERGQIPAELIRLEGVTRVTDLKSAIAAIEAIVEQGEGAPGDREGSHYRRFQTIRKEYAAAVSEDASFAPAWPAASNPVMRRPPDPVDKVFVDDPNAARVLDFANGLYALLLRLLVQCFGRNDDCTPVLMHAATALMHILGEVSAALTQMPASHSHPGINAGMTFTMLRSVAPLVVGAAELRLIVERFDALIGAAPVAARANPALAGFEGRLREARDTLTASFNERGVSLSS